MKLIKISWSNIKGKPLNAFLSLLLLTFGVGLISLLLLMQVQLSQQFHKNIDKIDLVLGAKGSPLQLILSSVYQVDAPTGNIPLKDARKIMKNLFVEQAVPMAFGDSYKDYRIVGTTKDYTELFEAELKEGRLWEKPFEVCLGEKVANESGLSLGDEFYSSHGLDGEGEAHENHAFKVVGIYKSNKTVVDKVIMTSIKSLWDVHSHGDEAEVEISAESLQSGKYLMMPEFDEEELTAALLIKNSNNIFQMIQNIVRKSNMQAVMPSVEVNRLENNFGIGMKTLYVLGGLIALLSFLSVFISLYNSLKERKYELALIRTMGGTRFSLFAIIVMEGLILALLGFIFGIVLSRIGLKVISYILEDKFQYSISDMSILTSEWLLLIMTIFVGILASFLPALSAVRLDISKTLSDAK